MVLNIDIEKVEEIKNYYLDIIDNYNGSFTQKEIEDKVITHFPMIGADTVSCVWLKLCIGLIKQVKDNYDRKLTDKEIKEIKKLMKEMQKQVNSEINNNEKIIN